MFSGQPYLKVVIIRILAKQNYIYIYISDFLSVTISTGYIGMPVGGNRLALL